MIKLDVKHLGKIDARHGLSEKELRVNADQIAEFLEKFKKREQGFHEVVDNKQMLNEVHAFGDEVKGKYEDIVLLGIGGSALGTICLQQSLKHLYENELEDREYPQLHAVDNIDPSLISEIQDVINFEKTLFLVVSKSGGTPETLAEYFYFRDLCEEKGLDIKEHFVFITDPKKGLLRKVANEEGIRAFDVPGNVGGRFSVLTNVSLIPAKLIGIDIDAILEGAREAKESFLNTNFDQNLPFQLANIQYSLDKKGKFLNVLIPYSHKLIRFSDWYRQLLAESIGKAFNDLGKKVNTGLTPINALGATDQHSQNQLYNEGPNDKFFMFIKINDFGKTIQIPYLHPNEESANFLRNIDFRQLIHTEMHGTIHSLVRNDRPVLVIEIERIDAKTLGTLIMFFKCATAFLGELYEINAFNQPGVELSKQLTKKLLLDNS